jgi:hypothetical protein
MPVSFDASFPRWALIDAQGMKACQYFEVKVRRYEETPDKFKLTRTAKHYTWRGFRQSRGIRSKTKRVLTQFSPHDFTAFHWHGTASLIHYVTVVMLLAVFLAAELNPFYLKVSTANTYPAHFMTNLNTIPVGFRVSSGWSPITLS